jgi:type IV fimbrial biogenesis protein FimT
MLSPHPARSARRGRAPGFSAIELLAAVAILAVLVSLAAPGFTLLLERWRVRQAAADLQATLYYARSEAIKRGGNVVVRKNVQNMDGCKEADTTQAWGCGWFVFVDTNGNGTRQAGEALLQTSPPPRQLNIMRNPSGAMLRFDRYGMANGANIFSFTISPAGPGIASPATQTLCMASGGRIRVLEGEAACQ